MDWESLTNLVGEGDSRSIANNITDFHKVYYLEDGGKICTRKPEQERLFYLFESESFTFI